MLENLEAVILCGGLGTRLRPIVPDLPKCLAPVGGRRFLEYLLLQLRSFGISRVTLCVGFRGAQVEDYFQSGSRWGVRLFYQHEPQPLGTGGALKQKSQTIQAQTFLALNGDSLFDADLAQLVSAHRARKACATVAIVCIASAGRYGQIDRDGSGKISAFHPGTKPNNLVDLPAETRAAVNAGIYIFEREAFDAFSAAPLSAQPLSLESEILPRLIGQGLYGEQLEGYFIDIGVPEDYERAQEELPWRFQQG